MYHSLCAWKTEAVQKLPFEPPQHLQNIYPLITCSYQKIDSKCFSVLQIKRLWRGLFRDHMLCDSWGKLCVVKSWKILNFSDNSCIGFVSEFHGVCAFRFAYVIGVRSGNRRIVLHCYWRSCFCCLQQSISLSHFKQCSYESTPRPFFDSLFYWLVSYSTLSEQKIHFQKFSKCFNNACNRILLLLPLWQGKYIQGCLAFYRSFLVFQLLPLFSPAWWLVTSLFTRDFLSISLCLFNFFLCVVLRCKLCSALSYHYSFLVSISYSNLCL